jgi:glutamate N-acetyltransferase/amino-acid N-acetyltransferase
MRLLENGGVTSAKGFSAAATACGLKKNGKPDLALVVSERDCAAAGVFTQNLVAAAPVILDIDTLSQNRDSLRAVVINAGNANACTGAEGLHNARETQALVASAVGCGAEQVLVMSTGVIGVPLNMEKVKRGVAAASQSLSPAYGHASAQAIMTTDTRPKEVAVQFDTPHGPVTIGGMAKGAGMIHPNMATMLAVITTDAAAPAPLLQQWLTQAVNRTFNRISVDGDTSTNDTVLLLANGASGVAVSREPLAEDLAASREPRAVSQNSPTAILPAASGQQPAALFPAALHHVCLTLAQMIVRDGEGATKVAEIRVTGADHDDDAHRIAETIATSPLFKTALAGGDANWGRIVAAAGRAGIPFDPQQTSLTISGPGCEPLTIFADGMPTGYEERDAAAIFAQTDVLIHLNVGRGRGADTMWTCDFTAEYVAINADYRT